MEQTKTGDLIRALRQEHGMTQKQLADRLHVSDKTISKWERALGYPDVSLLPLLAELFSVEVGTLLGGELSSNDFVGGNMKQTTYYVCPHCHNISLCSGEAEVSCCGKKLRAQTLQKAEPSERLSVEVVEDEWFISSEHAMSKEHYISFLAFATGDSIHLVKQYPEWNLQCRLPKRGHGMLLWYCLQHGLFYQLL